MERDQVKEQLIGLFPPGTEKVIDWQDEPGELVDVVAGVVKDFGTDLADKLFREVNPLTCEDVLPGWEAAFRLTGGEVAVFGTLQQRRNQVVARWREKGPPTLAKIRAVIGPLLDYADPSQLVILETDRAALRAAHTRTWMGSLPFTLPPALITWNVLDRAKTSKGGAQVDVTITHPDLSEVQLTLVAPDGRTLDVYPLGRGAATAATFRGFFPKMFGSQIAGTWQLFVYAYAGLGTITRADLFVEGVGRDSAGLDGLGAAMGYWGPVADPALMGPSANLVAAAQAVRRINYATRNGRIIRKSGVMTAICVCPDEPAAIPDECIPC